SSGARDDLIQRRALDAYHLYWDSAGANNPLSGGGVRMIENVFVWAWDMRPFPAFPARSDVWADCASWRLGHWLNGRGALNALPDGRAHLCLRPGLEGADVANLSGAVSGYVVDAPSTARAAIEPLMAAYAFEAVEREGRITFFHADDAAILDLPVA